MEFRKLVTIKEKHCRIKKGTRKKMKTHENKTCLLSFYHLVIIIIMQQLSSGTYRHLHI
jgi:hypothetical protein